MHFCGFPADAVICGVIVLDAVEPAEPAECPAAAAGPSDFAALIVSLFTQQHQVALARSTHAWTRYRRQPQGVVCTLVYNYSLIITRPIWLFRGAVTPSPTILTSYSVSAVVSRLGPIT